MLDERHSLDRELINQALARMSEEVRRLYLERISFFDANIEAIDNKIDEISAITKRNDSVVREFIYRFELAVGHAPPEAFFIIRPDRVKNSIFNDISGVKLPEYSDTNPLKPSAGKAILQFAVNYILHKNGLFDGRGPKHGAFVGNYVTRIEYILDSWKNTGFTDIMIGLERAFHDSDVKDCYYRLLHFVFRNFQFEIVLNLVNQTANPVGFVSRYQYDIFVLRDPKTYLQEYFQNELLIDAPEYTFTQESGRPDHDPLFFASVQVPGIGKLQAHARAKMAASRLVAEMAINALREKGEKRFVKYEGAQSERFFRDRPSGKAGREADMRQINNLSAWIKGTDLPVPLSEMDVFECFCASPGCIEYGQIARNAGLFAQIGSQLVAFVARSVDSNVADNVREKRVLDYFVRKYEIKDIHLKLFRTSGVNIGFDAVQAIMFRMFIINSDITLDFLRREIDAILKHHKNELADNPKDGRNIDKNSREHFDKSLSYAQILQEYTQSLPSRDRPDYEIAPDLKKMHDPLHLAICRYGGLEATGRSRTMKEAKNIAAFNLLAAIKGSK